tara:strand:- start:2 stop:322 length:321 start_codon:yes stop_codon:yes gene_type:complete
MTIDAITAGVLANAAFQILSHSAKVTASALKEKLSRWALSNSTLQNLEEQLEQLKIDDDMSPKKIEKLISESSVIINALKDVQPVSSTVINQTNKFGDNIGIQHNN